MADKSKIHWNEITVHETGDLGTKFQLGTLSLPWVWIENYRPPMVTKTLKTCAQVARFREAVMSISKTTTLVGAGVGTGEKIIHVPRWITDHSQLGNAHVSIQGIRTHKTTLLV